MSGPGSEKISKESEDLKKHKTPCEQTDVIAFRDRRTKACSIVHYPHTCTNEHCRLWWWWWWLQWHRQCQVWWQCGGKHLEHVGWGTRLGGSGLGIGGGIFSSSGPVQDRFSTFPSKLCHRLSTPEDPEQFKEWAFWDSLAISGYFLSVNKVLCWVDVTIKMIAY